MYDISYLNNQTIEELLDEEFVYDRDTSRILETFATNSKQNDQGTADSCVPNSEKQGKIGKRVGSSAEKNRETIGNNESVNPVYQPIKQRFKSAGTSLNQVAALFKNKHFHPGKINIDIGGGKFDATSNFLRSLGTENYVSEIETYGFEISCCRKIK